MIEYSNQHFPEIEPYHTFRLKVSDLHELYVEECGNPKGKPVVFLHGGPGGGISPKHRRYFDPKKYRIVLFDQRGCGRSTPFASIEQNTTQEILLDIEKIRTHLNIEKWQVFGGSWGSYLGLLYAQQNPTRVTEIILRGLFMATQREIDWLYKFGASEMFHKEWLEFKNWIPENEQSDLLTAYHKRLNHPDMNVCVEAAKKWNRWEMSILSLYKDESALDVGENALPFARIECYYAVEKYFSENDRVFREMDRVQHIPGILIHGQYDMVATPRTAYEIHALWPKSELRMVADAGHSASEPGITHELISATNKFA
jgi:proline iminopeptidase